MTTSSRSASTALSRPKCAELWTEQWASASRVAPVSHSRMSPISAQPPGMRENCSESNAPASLT
eukprot:CAMPEP_0204015420 /NCGR_PEP_ID=MMETSP0360-20130528/26062_1 /ASSEMBLY_ACC=CAM_ASM_000342 /TAXON_ID=268821 /ORGANISM="Scrippsiella Hangoei, Strain SHTV-5" /LENGTH=63 /DNA_ID=CAMNT_0050958343 /DNA_START=42 /DNA_END=233 /DNA_ORIENTATION=-